MGARAVNTDFIHSMRFHVTTGDDAARPSLDPSGERAGAGFSQVTTPEATTEAVEYREGTYIYTRKYPGLPTMSDISLMRGVARGDSSFWDWMRKNIEGPGEYRSDILIKHFHRDPTLARDTNATGAGNNQLAISTENPARTYKIHEAFPTRHKVAGDLDANASEISLMEIDLAYEHFEVEEHAQT